MLYLTEKIRADIEKEIEFSRCKFPPFHSGHEAYAVILEEVEELWDCIKKNNSDNNKYNETIQIISMCLCYIREVLQRG